MTNVVTGMSGKDCSSFEDFLAKNNIKRYVLSHQVHGTAIFESSSPAVIDGYDALVTTCPDLTLIVKAADCVPILLYDRTKPLIAAIHAGRRGTEAGISKKVIEYLIAKHGCDPKNLKAWIGPSICVNCYQIDQAKDIHYDLWANNQAQCRELGVTQIELSGVCTACSGNARYYSYRADKTELRNYAFITLK
jgi:copper oxidase (laccase) domain-containing protein